MSDTNTMAAEIKAASAAAPGGHKSPVSDDGRPFRFYDNRQKYLAFVNTCNEKWKVAERAAQELAYIKPKPPAVRLFDAGMGDGTVLAHVMRAMHRRFPTYPHLVVGKEISLEDVRLTLEKLPDRFVEHPASIVVVTNLYYAEAPHLMPNDVRKAAALNWSDIALDGTSAHEFGEQLRALEDRLMDGWQVSASEETGNPHYVRPSVLVLYRRDHQFVLDDVIPKPGHTNGSYDLVIVSQPWRSRMQAAFRVSKVLAPLTRSLREHGRAVVVQSYGQDPGLELIHRMWPDEQPFTVDRHELIRVLKTELGRDARGYHFKPFKGNKGLLQYQMHTLPSEIGSNIGTSTLFAAWNAAIYVAQIEDERLESVLASPDYLHATAEILKTHGGLWFNDEVFVVSKQG